MPAAKYVGSSGGSGNPPGKYSKSGLSPVKTSGHFVSGKEYRGSMHVGVSSSASAIGNQPKARSSAELGLRTKAI